MLDVIVIGAGPEGLLAALRAADPGARTALITRDEFGGMAANDGPVPALTLAHFDASSHALCDLKHRLAVKGSIRWRRWQ
jgi:pyruvate/2-oxoglutarate dehydrogenase complex dihydrolipoamide dehydrogenase (E3) component